MTKLEKLKREIEALPPEDIRTLGAWLDELCACLWDEQIERDVNAGRFDKLAEQALAEHRAGKSMPLVFKK